MSKSSGVASFGPELLQLLLKAGREPVRVPKLDTPLESYPTWRELNRLRQRCSALKVRLVATHHPMADIATRARFVILWGEKAGLPTVESRTRKRFNTEWAIGPLDKNAPAVLLGQPNDLEFRDILTSAGITIETALDSLSLSSQPALVLEPPKSDIDSLLRQLKEKEI